MQVVGIVLAAGASSRMGRPKALLTVQGRSFLARILAAQTEAGIGQVVLVTGVHDEVIRQHVAEVRVRVPVELVTNPDPTQGQLSSLLLALDAAERAMSRGVTGGATPGGVEAILVWPVDFPLVRPATVRALLAAANAGAPVVRPVFAGRHGHPVLFARRFFPALRAAPPDQGARAVVRALGTEVCDVEVADAGVCEDIDTPEEYARVLREWSEE
jgi:CTP:molybdopterin cytidylyltransferase MocA